MKNILLLLVFFFSFSVSNAQEKEQIATVLDAWHKAAAEANFNNYLEADFTESAPSIDMYLTEPTKFGWFNFYADKDRQGMFVIDKIIHCAGKVGGVGGNMNYKGDFFYDNIMINTNVIEAARKAGVEKLVAFLSTCIFPNDIEYPLTEAKIHLGPPHSSNDAYAYAKRMADIQIRAYREQYGLKYTSVIPTNIYGPNDNYDIVNVIKITFYSKKTCEICKRILKTQNE